MMMAPLFHETNARPGRRVALGVLAIFMVLATTAFYTETFRIGALRLIEPILLARAYLLGNTTMAPIESYVALKTENDQLHEEVALAGLAIRQSEALVLENRELREELSLRDSEGPSVRAAILRRPPETRYDTLLIAAGKNEGVEPEYRISAGAAFLGRVVTVGKHVSSVVLASAPGEETHAFLLHGTSTHPARLTGLGQGAFESAVPRTVPVAAGDSVFVFTDVWEVVGVVASVKDTPTDALLRITVLSPVNMWHLRSVDVRPHVVD